MKPVAVFAGLIRLRSSPFPKLQGTEYVLNVTATDDNASGGPHSLTSTAQVIVKIDDVNNNKPVFQKVQIYETRVITLGSTCFRLLLLQVTQQMSNSRGDPFFFSLLGASIFSISHISLLSLMCFVLLPWLSTLFLNPTLSLAF